MNVVHLLGRIGKDPEVKYSQSGMAVCNCSLATNKKIKGEDKTQWHRLVSFGKTAELISQYVKKGDMLGIEGEISYGQYEKDGITRYTTDIIVNRIHFVGGGNKQAQGGQGGYSGGQGGYNPLQQPVPSNTNQNQQQQPSPDDQIPF